MQTEAIMNSKVGDTLYVELNPMPDMAIYRCPVKVEEAHLDRIVIRYPDEDPFVGGLSDEIHPSDTGFKDEHGDPVFVFLNLKDE